MKSIAAAFLFALGLASQAQAASVQVAPDRLIVAFKKGMTAEQRRAAVVRMGGRVLADLDLFGMTLVAPGLKPAAVIKAMMAQQPFVVAVDNDFTTKWLEHEPMLDAKLRDFQAAQAAIRAARTSVRPEGLKGGLTPPQSSEIPWGVARVNASSAWPTNKGEGIKVAVVDTGIDPTHPDLAGKVAGGTNAVEKGGSWADDHFHGTHVAGTIAAALDEKGVVGVAPAVTLYSVKVLTKEGSGSLFGILEGMMWCAQNGMTIANMSLGAAQGNFIFEYGVQQMVGQGVTLVAAAGNGDGNGGPAPVGFPAAYKEAIAVSAGTPEDKITPWSSRGPEVDFIAPGLKIPSTVPLSHDPSGIKAYSGTSMATPHVAGLAALAAKRGAKGPDGIRRALEQAASRLPGLSGDEQGNGLIDAAKLK